MIRIFFLIALFLFSSCNLQPKYSTPEVPLVEQYRYAPENIAEYVNLPWWEQFEDPVLNDLIAMALKNNQDLHVATANVLEFYAKYEVVFSQLFPQISGEFNDQRIKWNTDRPAIYSLYQLFANLSYELDFWGSLRNQSESAHAEFLAQVDVRLNVILSIVSAVAKGYILLLQYDNQLRIAKETLKDRMELWRIAKARYEAGLVSFLDVKQAETIVEGAEVEIRNYEGLIPIQEDLISVLLGIPPAPVPRGKLLQEFELPPEIPTGLPSDLLANRPDLLQAEQNLISSNALIGVARASFLPVFTITGVDGKQSYETHDLFKKIATYFDGQLNILQPLYTGGQLTGQLREAEAAFLSNYYTYQQTFLVALQEVSDSLVNHQTAKDVYEIQVKESDAYEEYVRIAKIRYYNGLNDYLTVIDAEQNYFQVQLDTETTRGTIFSSLVDIYTALGQGWDVEADYCEKCDDPSPIWNALPFTRG